MERNTPMSNDGSTNPREETVIFSLANLEKKEREKREKKKSLDFFLNKNLNIVGQLFLLICCIFLLRNLYFIIIYLQIYLSW